MPSTRSRTNRKTAQTAGITENGSAGAVALPNVPADDNGMDAKQKKELTKLLQKASKEKNVKRAAEQRHAENAAPTGLSLQVWCCGWCQVIDGHSHRAGPRGAKSQALQNKSKS